MRILCLCLFSIFLSGCLSSAPYWIRRAVVHNDCVLVKRTGVLYRRYLPSGIRLRPNKELLAIEPRITNSNEDIIVFRNYQEAIQSGLVKSVHEDSVSAIPSTVE